MKKLITSRIFSFILGALIFSGVAVFAYSISSKDIAFTPTDPEWQVENVEEAMNSLYDKNKKFDSFEYNLCCGSNSYISLTLPSILPYVTIVNYGGSLNHTLNFIDGSSNFLSSVQVGNKYEVSSLPSKILELKCTTTTASDSWKCFKIKYTNK